MNSLRVVVFLWFLASLLLLIAIFALSVMWSGPLLVYASFRHFGGPLISYAARQTITVYEAEGAPGVSQFESTASSGGIRVALLDGQLRVLRQPAPPIAREDQLAALGRSTPAHSMEFQLLTSVILLATRISSATGEYVVVLELPRNFISALPVPWAYVLTRLSLLLIGAALLCSWLAYKISTPLFRLRASTRAFASGDLTARAGPTRGAPREIQDLSHDFDEMAGRIEMLVDSQTRLLQYVSHELRTPLTRLNLSIEAARRHLSTPAPDLDRIETEATRLNALLQRILHLSRLEAAAQPLVLQKIELADFLETIVADADFEAQAGGKHVQLTAAGECRIEGDREWLRGAIENVIRNAIRFTPPGSAVHVSARIEAAHYRILVEDQGPGLPPGLDRQIFEPFYRVGGGHGEGFGLGLAIARRVTELHGGQIRAANRLTVGLGVEILLPLPLEK